MKNIDNDGFNSDDNELEVTDIDDVPKGTKIPRLNRLISGQRLSTRVRLGMAVLTLVGCIILLTAFAPTAGSLLGWQAKTPVSPSPTTRAVFRTQQPIYATVLSGVVPFNDMLYLYNVDYSGNGSQPHTVDAIDRNTGSVRWRSTKSIIQVPPLINGVLYLPTVDGVDALDASNQKLLWHINTRLTNIQIVDGVVYGSTIAIPSGLAAFRVSNGSLLWQHDTSTEIWKIENGLVYCSTHTDKDMFEALRASDGSVVWQHAMSNQSYPFVEAGSVFLLTPTLHTIDVLRASDGSESWHTAISSQIYSFINGIVYTLSASDNNLVAFNVENGALLWQKKVYASSYPVLGASGDIYTSDFSSRRIEALRPDDGQVLWTSATIGDVISVQDGEVCVRAYGDKYSLRVLNARDGSLRWKSEATFNDLQSPLIKDGVLYLNSQNQNAGLYGSISAFNFDDGRLLWRHNEEGYFALAQSGEAYLISQVDGTLTALHANGAVHWQYHSKTP